MAEGQIKKLTDKGFGFIAKDAGQEIFFHANSLEGVSYEELREGQRVSFEEQHGDKGPYADKVTVL